MALWQDTVRQIRALMEQTAAFRAISTSRSTSRLRVPSYAQTDGLRLGGSAPDSLVLVITDGVAEAGATATAAAYLYSSAQTSPTAVLSLLPQEMWEITLPTAVRAQLAVHDAAVRTGSSDWAAPAPRPRSSGSAPDQVRRVSAGARSVAGVDARIAGTLGAAGGLSGGRHDLAVLLTSRHGDPEARSHHSATLPRPLPGRAARR